MNCPRYLKFLMLLMLIYLAIHSHFSIVYNSFLILQNIQILAQPFQECISVHELNLNAAFKFAALKHLSFYQFQRNPKILTPPQMLTIYCIKLCGFLLEH